MSDRGKVWLVMAVIAGVIAFGVIVGGTGGSKPMADAKAEFLAGCVDSETTYSQCVCIWNIAANSDGAVTPEMKFQALECYYD